MTRAAVAMVALALAGAVGLACWQGRSRPQDPTVAGATAGRPASGQAPASSPRASGLFIPEQLQEGAEAAERLALARAREEGGHAFFDSDAQFQRARQKQVLMTEVPVAALAQQIAPEDQARAGDGRRWIRYEMELLAARVEGDRFILSLPGEGPVEAQVDRVDVGQGLYRWSGHMLTGTGGSFSVTQSMQDGYAIGAFRVEGAEFLMEAKRGVGWVADAAREFHPDAQDADALRPAPAASSE